MILNDDEIKVTPKPAKHKGFVDSEGKELLPGDIVCVRKDKTVRLAMIVRFTKTTVNCCPLMVHKIGDNPDLIKSRQHYYDYPNVTTGVIKLRGICKVEDVL